MTLELKAPARWKFTIDAGRDIAHNFGMVNCRATIAIAAFGWIAMASGAAAQTSNVPSKSTVTAAWTAPRTPDGRPDLQTGHEARMIPLDGRPHVPASVRQWNGDSRGHWEGDTLVVDTTNFSPKSNFMGAGENLHLVERFTRTAADTITYLMSFDDKTTWTKPWTAEMPLKAVNQQLYEYACHEGNFEMMRGTISAAHAAAEQR